MCITWQFLALAFHSDKHTPHNVALNFHHCLKRKSQPEELSVFNLQRLNLHYSPISFQEAAKVHGTNSKEKLNVQHQKHTQKATKGTAVFRAVIGNSCSYSQWSSLGEVVCFEKFELDSFSPGPSPAHGERITSCERPNSQAPELFLFVPCNFYLHLQQSFPSFFWKIISLIGGKVLNLRSHPHLFQTDLYMLKIVSFGCILSSLKIWRPLFWRDAHGVWYTTRWKTTRRARRLESDQQKASTDLSQLRPDGLCDN